MPRGDVFGHMRGERPAHQRRVLSHAHRVYILRPKVAPDELARAEALARDLGAIVCGDRADANIFLTALAAPRRIALHTTAAERDTKAIVRLAWLDACDAEGVCATFDSDADATPTSSSATPPSAESAPPQHAPGIPESPRAKRRRLLAAPTAPPSVPAHATVRCADEETDAAAWRRAPGWTNTEYAVLRPTPLRSPYNQALVDELQLLRRQRRLAGDEHSEMAYMRASAAVKAAPFPLSDASVEELRAIKGVGAKMAMLIRQFSTTGSIAEADTIRADSAVQTMMEFMDLYGVGPRSAVRAYNDGCRTLSDLAARQRTALPAQLGAAESLALLPDLLMRIPRAEVACIAGEIADALAAVCGGCEYVITGGYRRGKALSGDVDIVATYAGDARAPPGALLRALTERLRAEGRVTHVVALAKRAHTSATDGGAAHAVDVAEFVYLSHASGSPVHRRVDVVFAQRAQYGAAVLGWSGSVLYERDLRRWARQQGYKFSASGVVRLADGALMETPTEGHVYELLGLVRMPPRLRNTD
ncbi:DNA-directed DNA polymerase [Malassezia sp. CBS 17886]|nr:DNA-directed DNA polymerase [Malassezia sp. CBS 17886]